MIDVKFDFSALGKKLDAITSAAGKATRPAAQAGAQVLYEEVRARAGAVDGNGKHSEPGKSPLKQSGELQGAIYQAFADKDSNEGKSTYRISWNKKEAWYGRILETGTSKMAARPFLRPAYDAARAKALQAANERMQAEVKKALK